MSNRLGFSGGIAQRFQATQITPLLALVGVLLGVFAVLVTPREEEPQINVTFANVFIPFPGAAAEEVESLVSSPAEQVLSEIDGIDHVYSTSMPGMAVLTVQYIVGENRTDAIVRLFSKIFSKQDWLPPGLGVGQPIVKPKGIDDVPIVSLTLWSDDPNKGVNIILNLGTADAAPAPVQDDPFSFGIEAAELDLFRIPEGISILPFSSTPVVSCILNN